MYFILTRQLQKYKSSIFFGQRFSVTQHFFQLKCSLAPEKGGKLLGDPLEDLLDGGGVADEGSSHSTNR